MDISHEQPHSKTLSDYLAIARRRAKLILVSGLITFALGILTVIFLPSTFRSAAVILIEEQDIPQDLVRSTITSYAVQRIEEIKQRIMTTNNIMSIAEQFQLYSAKEFERMTRTEISRDFRANVSISPISADVIDPRSGRPTEAVIAFKLSFDGKKPRTVHKVTNELVTLYLNENLKERVQQSNSTSEFLAAEASALNRQLTELENNISSFKEDNQGSLPELNRFNLSIVDRSQQELLGIITRTQELERRKLEIESNLSQLSPNAPQVLPSGESVLSDRDRLKALRSEYRRLSAIYKEGYPDLKRLQREIQNLENKLGSGAQQEDLAKELQTAKDQLSRYENKYAPQHPSLKAQRNLVKDLEQALANSRQNPSPVAPDNPAYVLLNTQLESIKGEISALQSKSIALRERINKHDTLLSKMPVVEKDYQALLRDYDNAQLKYREIKAKQMEAELARNLEQERKGERFTLIQPPEIPEKPVSPNRILLLVLTLIAASGISVGVAILAEMIDNKVYGERAILSSLGIPALGYIPYMESEDDKAKRKRLYLLALAGLFLLGLILLLLFHFFIKPLDVTWFILLRKLGLH